MIRSCSCVCVVYSTRNVNDKIVQIKLHKNPNLQALLPFATETSLVSVAKRMFFRHAGEIFKNEAATLSSQAVFSGVLLAYFQSELE